MLGARAIGATILAFGGLAAVFGAAARRALPWGLVCSASAVPVYWVLALIAAPFVAAAGLVLSCVALAWSRPDRNIPGRPGVFEWRRHHADIMLCRTKVRAVDGQRAGRRSTRTWMNNAMIVQWNDHTSRWDFAAEVQMVSDLLSILLRMPGICRPSVRCRVIAASSAPMAPCPPAPLFRRPAPDRSRPQRAAIVQRSSAPTAKMAHLLVIDDDAGVREVIRLYLDGSGHRVIELKDGYARNQGIRRSVLRSCHHRHLHARSRRHRDHPHVEEAAADNQDHRHLRRHCWRQNLSARGEVIGGGLCIAKTIPPNGLAQSRQRVPR